MWRVPVLATKSAWKTMRTSVRVAFFLAVRSIQKGNRFTFFLTVAIMSLVFVNLIFLPSIISGVVVVFDTQAINYNYGNLIVEPRENEVYISQVADLKRKIDQIPVVTGTSPRLSGAATYQHKGQSVSGSLISFNPRYEQDVTLIHTKIIDGEYLSEGDTDSIVLGTTLAGNRDGSEGGRESLGGVVAGDSISVTFSNGVVREMKVKGILDSGVYALDQSGFVSLNEMERVLGVKDKGTQILVKAIRNGKEKEYKNTLMEYGIQERIKTYQDKNQDILNQVVTSFNMINGISTAVSLIIAIVIIFIVIFINTVNKRRQIGILKAIGIDKRVIVYSYIFQVLVLATCGSIFGIILASGLIFYLTVDPLIFPGCAVYPVVEPLPIIRSILSIYIVSLISGFVPSYRIANEPILDAIRGA